MNPISYFSVPYASHVTKIYPPPTPTLQPKEKPDLLSFHGPFGARLVYSLLDKYFFHEDLGQGLLGRGLRPPAVL